MKKKILVGGIILGTLVVGISLLTAMSVHFQKEEKNV